MMQFEKEKLFILRSLRAFVRGTDLAGQPNRFSGLNWNWIIGASRAGRVLPFLIDTLGKNNLLPVLPFKNPLAFESLLMQAEHENHKKLEQFKTVNRLFEQSRIPVIPLKGAGLSHLVYQKAPFRWMGDIDILVRESDLGKARQILINHGFTFSEPKNKWQAAPTAKIIGRWSFIRNPIDLDLQWAPKFFVGRELVSWNQKNAWDRAESFSSLGSNVLMLSPLDQASYLLLQILNDLEINAVHMIQLIDLALVMHQYQVSPDEIPMSLQLNAGSKARIFDFITQFKICFLEESLDPKFSDKFMKMLDPFFELKQRPQPGFAVKRILNLIPSPRERFLFILGYLIPSLNGKTPVGFKERLNFYLEHWKKQCTILFKILLRQN